MNFVHQVPFITCDQRCDDLAHRVRNITCDQRCDDHTLTKNTFAIRKIYNIYVYIYGPITIPGPCVLWRCAASTKH